MTNNAVTLWSLIAGILLVPQPLLRRQFPIAANEIELITKKTAGIGRHRLSVIMPAYNEINTIRQGIEKVLNKQLRGMDIELIIVESNSTDGTKDIVNLYKDHPRVNVVFEQKPSGKGHAVRAGFEVAIGDFILIQDADNEYDIQDYEILLEPLISGREVFVLGARHGVTSWNVRKFSDQPMRAILLNLGHWIFATLINVLYGVRLKDPFTMYKVFRRDCIQDIVFECNRFDFDHELVLKLIRKGFRPIEIPVRYHSRSFAHGKKVRIFADPLSWLRAIIKYRFVKV
jgi:glycosyltransferase involved in cell wall biosynthesis